MEGGVVIPFISHTENISRELVSERLEEAVHIALGVVVNSPAREDTSIWFTNRHTVCVDTSFNQ